MKFTFEPSRPILNCEMSDWLNPSWQIRNSIIHKEQFFSLFDLSENEIKGFDSGKELFKIRATPYYLSLINKHDTQDPIRKMIIPTGDELNIGSQQMLDPLGENRHRPTKRIIHRYPDRVLFLVTDFCTVYCRYCTRKHFTGKDQVFPSSQDYQEAIKYISKNTHIREVILSGGDPLTISNSKIEKVLADIRNISHVEIIRLGTRIPVVCPMRVDDELIEILKKYQPVYIMNHFNHPRELTQEAAQCLTKLADNGFPMMNQMVLLKGVNNHPAIVQALSRRLLYLRVKPYYMFQCDPSMGTDHLRISIEESMEIQKSLWGKLSGLAVPNLSLDIPSGGGKVSLVPNFEIHRDFKGREYVGWDGVKSFYINPIQNKVELPSDISNYMNEWNNIENGRYGSLQEEHSLEL